MAKSALLLLIAATVATLTSAQVVGTPEGTAATIPPVVGTPVVAPPTTNVCGNGNDAVFQTCLNNAQSLQNAGCGPLQAAQGYAYFDCMCRNTQSVLQCYDQCPSQTGPKATVQTSLQSYCNTAQQLKPKTSTTTDAAGNVVVTKTVMATSTPAPAASNSASSAASSGSLALVALSAAALLA
ncbi:hypothetical protein BC828DRAFT_406382 [Blastocladiella britannica]|nr:hypothetical protein BC828DRAFT_406382 [Blastocladiella britannica]